MVHRDLRFIIGHTDFHPFWDVYETESKFSGNGTKVYVPSPQEYGICRFCRRDAKTTSFKMDAHVIPEFMGNKELLSHFECDECNSLFSKYETDLSNYLGVWRTLSLLDGKNGVPKFNPNKNGVGEKFQVQFNPEERELNFRISGVEEPEIKSVKIDHESQKINIQTVRPTYVPRNALKALVKIAYCMLHESSLKYYEKTRRWLVNDLDETAIDDHFFFQVYQNQGGLINGPIVLLARKKSKYRQMPIPSHSLLFHFGIFMYQIFLPFHSDEDVLFRHPEFCLPIEEMIGSDFDPIKQVASVNLIDFSSKEPRRNEPVNIVMSTKQKKQ